MNSLLVPMPNDLPQRQREVLEAIERFWAEHGIAPSTGDLSRELGISRTTVHNHFLTLQRKGFLSHEDGKPRSWRLTRNQPTRVPIVGHVAAGTPIFAAENIEGWIGVDRVRAGETLFALRVRGDSMIDAGIFNGDLVVVRQQVTANNRDIVVALLDDDEATVKELRRVGDEVHLIAHNDNYAPIILSADRVRIQGRVIEVRRDLAPEEGEP